MTAIAMKTQTKQMLDTLSDEQIVLAFNYLQSLVAEHQEQELEREKKLAALERMRKMRRKIALPKDVDYKKEYMKAMVEKYESLG